MNKLTTVSALAILFLLIAGLVIADEKAPAAGEQIDWQVIASGGTDGGSSNYRVAGTVGQTAVGAGSSASYGMNHGYWQDFGAGDCICGDADNNGFWNISDAVFLISYIFGGGPAPDRPCLGDADGNEIVNISDAVYMISYIFGGGPEPGGCNPNQQWP
jgi:hypothetical protein